MSQDAPDDVVDALGEDGDTGPSLLSLLRDDVDTDDVDEQLETWRSRVSETLPVDNFEFEEDIVKENLGSILLLLIALRSGAHGKQLIDDLDNLFNTQLSPGTVYPILHDLNDEGILERHDKIRTKEYRISDSVLMKNVVDRSILQHLAFGFLLHSFETEMWDEISEDAAEDEDPQSASK